jgi:membrane fusion protein, multidrug efflux system
MNTPFFKFDWHATLAGGWRALTLVVALLVLIAIVIRWNAWEGSPGWQVTDDAYLQSDLTPIAAKVGGYLRELPAQDFQHVRRGALLAQIVDDDYRSAVEQAEANLAAASAQLDALQSQRQLQAANIEAAQAVVASTDALVQQNRRDRERQNRLLRTGSSSTEAAEKLDTTRAQLLAQLAQNRAQVAATERQLAVLSAQQAQAQASIAAQKAALAIAQLNLSYTRIVAPQDGVLGPRQVKPGQYVAAGMQITTLTPLPRVWVIANYKETQLTHMAVGQKAEITVDTFPGTVLHGHVLAFAPDSGAEAALLPPDNATGNFTKVVQRIPVKIALDDSGGLDGRLIAGMSVIARVDARDSRSR